MKNIHLHEKNQDTLTPKPEDTTVNRILAIIKYLNEETDPDTHIVPQRIADELKFCYGWNITRKTIAEYLKQMCSQDFNFGLECDSYKGNIKKYTYKRTFSFEQLSLLSDIICSSMFLDDDTAEELLENIRSLTSIDRSYELAGTNHYIRPRVPNKDSMHNIRIIHEAINRGLKIKYYYAGINKKKQLYYHKRTSSSTVLYKCFPYDNGAFTEKEYPIEKNSTLGKPVTVSPYKLLWDNSRCYLVCGLEEEAGVKVFNCRVDRMFEIQIIHNSSLKKSAKIDKPRGSIFYDPVSESVDAQKYLHSVFKMYPSKDGRVIKAKFRVKNYFTKVIVERFGFEVEQIPDKDDSDYFIFEALVQPTKTFFGWLACYKTHEVKLIEPPELVKEYRDYLSDILGGYE